MNPLSPCCGQSIIGDIERICSCCREELPVKEITAVSLLEIICKEMRQKPESVHERGRKREKVLVRQVFYYFTSINNSPYPMSLSSAATFFHGGFDHSTALHGKRTISNLIETDKKIAEQINNIWREIKNIIK